MAKVNIKREGNNIILNGKIVSPDEFMRWANKYATSVINAENPGWREQYFSKPSRSRKSNFTYLMIDTATGLYKIGRSTNPVYRERTLQSEKPTINTVWYCSFNIVTEKVLHLKFSKKRVRGEWFSLTESDVKWIINTYKY